jgi:biopolymer transport protein ExbB/TolQ
MGTAGNTRGCIEAVGSVVAGDAGKETMGSLKELEKTSGLNEPADWKKGEGTRGFTEDNIPLGGASAAVLTVLLYAGILPLLGESFLFDLLSRRGWVPYIMVFLSLWAFSILGLRWVALRRQERIRGVDLLSSANTGHITADAAPGLAACVRVHLKEYPDNILVKMICQALERFYKTRDARQAAEVLHYQVSADADRAESGNRVLKVFVAAIPILAFMGTVSGIGQAVSHFAQFIQTARDFTILQEGLRNVTAGLGVAFDTTLLGLSLSLLITLPMTFLQRAEERFLNYVEGYCEDRLFARLEFDASTGRVEHEEAIRRVIEAEMVKHTLVFKEWTNRLDETGKKIVSQVSEGMARLCSELYEREKAFSQKLADHETARHREMCRRLEGLQKTAESKFMKSFETIQRKAAALQQDSILRAEELSKVFKNLGSIALDSAKRQHGIMTAGNGIFAKTLKRHEETALRLQRQAEDAYRTTFERLDGFLSSSSDGLKAIAGQLDRMASDHESRMQEVSKSFAEGLEHAADRGLLTCEVLSNSMNALQENGNRIAVVVGDLNPNLARCASMLEQVRANLKGLASPADMRQKQWKGYGRRIARFFGRKESMKP